MGRISNKPIYPEDATITGGEYLIGTDANGSTTLNYPLSAIRDYIGSNSATWGAITGALSDQTDLQGVLDTKLSTVSSDATISGDGTSGSPLSVVSSSLSWGAITGTLSDQTDLQGVLDTKLSTVSSDATISGDGTSGSPLSAVPQNITTSGGPVISFVDVGSTALISGTLVTGSYRILDGSLVMINIEYEGMTSDVPLSGDFRIDGLPLSAGSTPGIAVCVLQLSNSIPANSDSISSICEFSGTSILFKDSRYNNVGAGLTFDGSGRVRVSGVYMPS
jgi:hypothetical protein